MWFTSHTTPHKDRGGVGEEPKASDERNERKGPSGLIAKTRACGVEVDGIEPPQGNSDLLKEGASVGEEMGLFG